MQIHTSAVPASITAAMDRNPPRSPNWWTMNPAPPVLTAAAMPISIPSTPCARLNRPVPVVSSVIISMVLPGGVARPDIIDFARSDLRERHQGRDAEDRRTDKNRAVREIYSERAHRRRGQCVAGGGETKISAHP